MTGTSSPEISASAERVGATANENAAGPRASSRGSARIPVPECHLKLGNGNWLCDCDLLWGQTSWFVHLSTVVVT
jgi:hypothetical protein